MSEEHTFNKLRQLPLSDMVKELESIKRPPPIYQLGASTVQRTDYYSEIQFHLEKMQLLQKNGWEFDEFLLALEKRSILEQIKDFNNDNQFPTELVERAKRFFPNAKFIQASIELE